MIELLVEPYCHDCPEFEAKVAHKNIPLTNTNRVLVKHIVHCEHYVKCDKMYKYLKKKASEQSAN